MLKSMTGYGRGEIKSKRFSGYVEVKTKNHKYRDINFYLPKKYLSFEIPLIKEVSGKVFRGKVDIIVRVNAFLEPDYSLSLNRELLKEYKKIIDEVANELGVAPSIDVIRAMQLNDLVVSVEDESGLKEDYSAIKDAVLSAVESLADMRSFEGEKLYNELFSLMAEVKDNVHKIREKRESLIDQYYAKIKDKIKSIIENINIDEHRLYQEVAYIIDKTDITEELTRLGSHLSHFEKIVNENEPVGKKLDFLFQEMNREINTIGSKANDFDIMSYVISLKNDIEKAREQAQNIE